MTCQSTLELIPQDIFAFFGHQMMTEMDMQPSLKESERAVKESRERSAEQLFDILEPVPFAVEGSDLGTTEDLFGPKARCINYTKKRQLVTMSDLPRLTCCVCHLHHKWAMKLHAAVRHFFYNSTSTSVSL